MRVRARVGVRVRVRAGVGVRVRVKLWLSAPKELERPTWRQCLTRGYLRGEVLQKRRQRGVREAELRRERLAPRRLA